MQSSEYWCVCSTCSCHIRSTSGHGTTRTPRLARIRNLRYSLIAVSTLESGHSALISRRRMLLKSKASTTARVDMLRITEEMSV
jgi:hypothetical protein